MALTLEQYGLAHLPVDDRFELVGLLWDSLHENDSAPPDWHIEELDRRISEANANPDDAIPWDEFKRNWLGEA